jgi:hypothetical protein
MNKKIKALGLAFVMASSATADEDDLLRQERIGGLRIDLPAATVSQHLDCQPQRGRREKWAADDAYHQDWQYPDCGVTLRMVSATRDGSWSIEAITVTAPSTLTTQRGIGIGSTRQAVIKAYQREWNQEESEESGNFVAGSLYGGLIFSFRNEKVNQIFFGVASE